MVMFYQHLQTRIEYQRLAEATINATATLKYSFYLAINGLWYNIHQLNTSALFHLPY